MNIGRSIHPDYAAPSNPIPPGNLQPETPGVDNISLSEQVPPVEPTKAISEDQSSVPQYASTNSAALEAIPQVSDYLYAEDIDYSELVDGALLRGKWSRGERRAYGKSMKNNASKSEDTPFALKINQLTAQQDKIKTQIQHSSNPKTSQALARSLEFITASIDVFTQLERSFDAGKTDKEQDSAEFLKLLTPLDRALHEMKPDLSSEDFSVLKEQLSDFDKMATLFVQPGQRIESNMGRLISRTYRRLDQIHQGMDPKQAGGRKRANETADLNGALQTYANDASDMITFMKRLENLIGDIKSGKVDRATAMQRARQSIPGTSNAFKNVFEARISAQIDIREAEEKARLATERLEQGRALDPKIESALTNGKQLRQQGQAHARGATASARQNNIFRAQLSHEISKAHQTLARQSTHQARAHLEQREQLGRESRTLSGQAQNLSDNAAKKVAFIKGSDYKKEFAPSVAQWEQEHRSLVGMLASVRTEQNQYDSETTALSTRIAQAEKADVQLEKSISMSSKEIQAAKSRYLSQQQADNDNALGDMEKQMEDESITSMSAQLKLIGFYGVGVEGMRGEAALSGLIKLDAKREADGGFLMSVTLGAEVSGEIKTFFYEASLAYGEQWTEGIKLDTLAEVRQFNKLLKTTINDMGMHGLDSPEAQSALNTLVRYAQQNRRSETKKYVKGAIKLPGNSGGSYEKSWGTRDQRDIVDKNNNGVHDAGKKLSRERTRYSKSEGNIKVRGVNFKFSWNNEYKLNGKADNSTFEFVMDPGKALPTSAISEVMTALEKADVPRDVRQDIQSSLKGKTNRSRSQTLKISRSTKPGQKPVIKTSILDTNKITEKIETPRTPQGGGVDVELTASTTREQLLSERKIG